MALSMILPLNYGNNGYDSFSDSDQIAAIEQNLAVLLMTNPGEYVMDGDFGVGLRNYLFENQSNVLAEEIKANINKQAGIYMPYIRINEIIVNFKYSDYNAVDVGINYSVSNNQQKQFFELTAAI